MKITFLILLFFIAAISFGQTIDQIRSDKDAITFITTNFSDLGNLRYSENRSNDFLENRKWDVADFDKNGKADLLITGTTDSVRNMAYVVLAGTSNQYTLKDVTPGGYFLIPVSVIKKIGNDNVIILLQSVSTKKWSDTLIYKFGVFLKYNSFVRDRKISLLHYRSTGCPGSCPVYKIIIDNLSRATLEATRLADFSSNPADSLQGTYYSKLSAEKFNELTELINYIDLSSLKSHYTISKTDQPTGIIEIVFTDSSHKRIDDYGKVGTPGLIVFHEYIDKLRFSESWKK